MKIAIPIAGTRLCEHFGHCGHFSIITVDPEKKEVLSTDLLEPPPHEPGRLPRWLREQGANVVIAAGIGHRAVDILAQNGVAVIVGAPIETPENLALAYLNGTLQAGQNVCDH